MPRPLGWDDPAYDKYDDYQDLTFRALCALVPEVPAGTLPTARDLRTRGGEETLFSAELDDQTWCSIYRSGYILYSRQESDTVRSTVYTVHACGHAIYQSPSSTTEMRMEGSRYGDYCSLRYRVVQGRPIRYALVQEGAFLDLPWYVPVTIACDARLDHSADVREHRRMVYTEDADIFADPDLWEEDKEDSREIFHLQLHRALRTLTATQTRVIRLLFGLEPATIREAARILCVSPSTVQSIYEGAIKKLKKSCAIAVDPLGDRTRKKRRQKNSPYRSALQP